MYYITAFRNPVPQGHTDPAQVLASMEKRKSHKKTYEVESLTSLTFRPKPIPYSVLHPSMGIPFMIGDPTPKATWYSTFRIPKRSGGMREIKAPNEVLKKEQRHIYECLRYTLGILEHDCAYGFVKGRSCKQSLEVHKANKSRWFLKLDFHNFFPSFTTTLLKDKLNEQAVIKRYVGDALLDQMLYFCTDENNTLVQGAPSSPYLANIAMVSFDHHFNKYCVENNLTYTRYADDMLISSPCGFDWRAVQDVVLELLESLGYNGLTLSRDKTRYGSYNGSNWNLGLMYNNNYDVTVGHRAKRTLKVIAHKWDLLTDEDKAHWKGVLAYYSFIEPEYFAQERFNVCRN